MNYICKVRNRLHLIKLLRCVSATCHESAVEFLAGHEPERNFVNLCDCMCYVVITVYIIIVTQHLE